MDLAINGARVLFEIENVPLLGTVQITQTLTVSWLVFAIITGLCIWLGNVGTVVSEVTWAKMDDDFHVLIELKRQER